MEKESLEGIVKYAKNFSIWYSKQNWLIKRIVFPAIGALTPVFFAYYLSSGYSASIVGGAIGFLGSLIAGIESDRKLRSLRTYNICNEAIRQIDSLVSDKRQSIATAQKILEEGKSRLPPLIIRSFLEPNAARRNICESLLRVIAASATYGKSNEWSNPNLRLTILEPNDGGGFNCVYSMGRDNTLSQRHIALLAIDNAKHLASHLWINSNKIISYSSTLKRAQKEPPQFTFFSEGEKSHLKSIIGYRYEENQIPKYMWFVDAAIEDFFCDSDDDRNADIMRVYALIFESFSLRLEYEKEFSCALERIRKPPKQTV